MEGNYYEPDNRIFLPTRQNIAYNTTRWTTQDTFQPRKIIEVNYNVNLHQFP